MIRVLVVHDVPLICNVIAAVLEDAPDIQVVAHATLVEEALAQAAKREIDVILVSTRLPHNGAHTLTQAVTEADPSTKVLVLGMTESKEHILRYVEAGASGYVLKDDSVDDLLAHIRAVHNNKAIASPKIVAALMSRVAELAPLAQEPPLQAAKLAELTPRERQVLELISRELGNQKIAHQLVIEVGTVKNHVHNILHKLGLNSRREAAAYWAARNTTQVSK